MPLFARAARVTILLLATALIAGCSAKYGTVDPAAGLNDPYERANRSVHKFNRGLDRAIVRPAGRGYTAILPDEVEDSIGAFASNLGEPSNALNGLLQGNFKRAGIATSRFMINSVLGIGGLADVASEFGVPRADTDFGETMHVWGVGEGAYLELPVVGPSTQRDTVGIIVDLVINPLNFELDAPEEYYGTVAGAAARLGDRGRFTDTVDAILYESADSYAQSRLIYLQNRRFDLGQEDPGTEIDPFELDTEGF